MAKERMHQWSDRSRERSTKIVTAGLLFGTQLFSYMIRFVFGVVAPTLMAPYHLSPKTMGYILSGWNWSYAAGLPLIGIVVDRFGPYIAESGGGV
jgi:MFS family permease